MSMLDNIDEKLKLMGRKAIPDAHAHGLPAVYLKDGAICWEYPGGELVDDAEHDRRLATEDMSQDSEDKAEFRRRIDSRYALLSWSPKTGEKKTPER